MGFGDVTNKLEAAALALLVANPIVGLTGYTGQSGSTRSHPSVVFAGIEGDEFPRFSGNFRIQLNCRIESSKDITTESVHRGYVSSLNDLMTDADIAANLSAALADFTCLGVSDRRVSESVEDRMNVSEITLECYCCGSDLT